MTISGKLALVVIYAIFSSFAAADEIIIDRVASRIVFDKKGEPLNIGLSFRCYRDGRVDGLWLMDFYDGAFNCSIEFSDLRVSNVHVRYSDVIPADIPETIVKEVWTYKNCKSVPVEINDSITITTQEGNSFSRTQTVARSRQVSSNFSVSIPIKAVKFGWNSTRNVSFQTSQQVGTVENSSRTVQTRQEISIKIPARTTYVVTLTRTLSNSIIEVSGIVEFDGNAVLKRRLNGVQNDGISFKLGKLSDIEPRVSKRRVELKGEIWNATAISMDREDTEVALSESDCSS